MIKLQRNLFEGDGYITQRFGNKLIIDGKDYYAQWGLKGHDGVDWGISYVPLYSCINGKCAESAYDKYGYGWYVKIENDQCGVLYAHLKEQGVKEGVSVSAGDELGLSGNSGGSTGPHLHFAVFPKPRDRSNGYNGYIDPFGDNIEWVDNLNEEVNMTLKETIIDWYDGEGKQHSVGWYVYEWFNEKKKNDELVEEIARKNKDYELLQGTLSEQNLTITNMQKDIDHRIEEVERLEDNLTSLRTELKEGQEECSTHVESVENINSQHLAYITKLEKIISKLREVKSKVKKDALWEAVKFPLRLLALAVIPFVAAYFKALPNDWAGIIYGMLIWVDKFLHELWKINGTKITIGGKEIKLRGLVPF